jgi:hypothetical protein
MREKMTNLKPTLIKGVDPWTHLSNEAILTYKAYTGKQAFIDYALDRHSVEEEEDYNVRRKQAVSLCKTKWAIGELTKVINNDKYRITRDFGEYNLDLQAIFTKNYGLDLDNKLKNLYIEGLLGGVSYLFISSNYQLSNYITEYNASLLSNNYTLYVLSSNQVSNILVDENGMIIQCDIEFVSQSEKEQMAAVLRYYDKKWELWEKAKTSGMFLMTQSGTAEIIPIVPCLIQGNLMDPQTISSPIFEVARIDKHIMNLISDASYSFSFFNFPMFAFPESGANPEQVKKLKIAPNMSFVYDSAGGAPQFIEPQSIHIEKMIRMVEFLSDSIFTIIGVAKEFDNSNMSGYSREYNYQLTNDTYREIHTNLNDIEMKLWYFLKQLISSDISLNDYSAFSQTISIVNPQNFEPGGGANFERLQKALESKFMLSIPEPVVNETRKCYFRQILSENISVKKLEELLDGSFTDRDESTRSDTGESTDTSDTTDESNNAVTAESGSTTEPEYTD